MNRKLREEGDRHRLDLMDENEEELEDLKNSLTDSLESAPESFFTGAVGDGIRFWEGQSRLIKSSASAPSSASRVRSRLDPSLIGQRLVQSVEQLFSLDALEAVIMTLQTDLQPLQRSRS